ncbi:MAG: crossover junction endodeoxyribonuclease RuvC [Alicyclobacillaceae bacterium]|nr:crossover junction endodeoxyribonuclease RuvC [Alicyclobacillaceae bacterium]
MKVLGIDPGIGRLGYGLVVAEGNRLRAEDFGCLETAVGAPTADRLVRLYDQICDLLARERPDAMAVEQLFFYRNVTTAFAVGQARGVVLLAARQAGAEVAEYTPMQIKQAVTGSGAAEKGQVQRMVGLLLGLDGPPRPDDAADALAAAICHIHTAPLLSRLKGGGRSR